MRSTTPVIVHQPPLHIPLFRTISTGFIAYYIKYGTPHEYACYTPTEAMLIFTDNLPKQAIEGS
jgi:hypothetical protein